MVILKIMNVHEEKAAIYPVLYILHMHLNFVLVTYIYLRIFAYESINFVCGYWYPKMSCLPTNIVIRNCTF